MNCALFDFFELVRFFADVNDLADLKCVCTKVPQFVFRSAFREHRRSSNLDGMHIVQDIAMRFY